MTVPHVGHLPLIALRPFFIVSSTPSTISFLALHLTQYPSGIKIRRPGASCALAVITDSLLGVCPYRQQGKGLSCNLEHSALKCMLLDYSYLRLFDEWHVKAPTAGSWTLVRRLRGSGHRNLTKCCFENFARRIPWECWQKNYLPRDFVVGQVLSDKLLDSLLLE